MLYINQLHLTSVMMLTGKIKLVEKDGDKDARRRQGGRRARSREGRQTCTAEQRAKVKELIAAYVKTRAGLGLEQYAGSCRGRGGQPGGRAGADARRRPAAPKK